jgi:hypothetical protein
VRMSSLRLTGALRRAVAVHPANTQDPDGVALVLDQYTRRLFPFIERILAEATTRARLEQIINAWNRSSMRRFHSVAAPRSCHPISQKTT